MRPPQGEWAALLAALDELRLPWRKTRATLTVRYGARLHPAYQWDVVDVPGRPVDKPCWRLSMQVTPQFPPCYPVGRFLSAAYYGENASVSSSTRPLTYVGAVHTPLMLLHSDEDTETPLDQTLDEFSALKQLGREVVFVAVPHENHDLKRVGSPIHRVERLHIFTDWFASHLH